MTDSHKFQWETLYVVLGSLYGVLCSDGDSNSIIRKYILYLLKSVNVDSLLSVEHFFFFFLICQEVEGGRAKRNCILKMRKVRVRE